MKNSTSNYPSVALKGLPGLGGGSHRQQRYAYAIRSKYVKAANDAIAADLASDPADRRIVPDCRAAEEAVERITADLRADPESCDSLWWIDGFAHDPEAEARDYLAELCGTCAVDSDADAFRAMGTGGTVAAVRGTVGLDELLSASPADVDALLAASAASDGDAATPNAPTSTNRWDDPTYPKDGYEVVDVEDLRETRGLGSYATCEMCGNESIRYAVSVLHPATGTRLLAGRVCASRLTGCGEAVGELVDAAERRGRRLDSFLSRHDQWEDLGSFESLTVRGARLAIAPAADGRQRVSCELRGRYLEREVATRDEAEVAAFDLLERCKEDLHSHTGIPEQHPEG